MNPISNIFIMLLFITLLYPDKFAHATAPEGENTSNKVFIIQSGYDYVKDDELHVASSIALIVSETAIVISDPGMTANRKAIKELLLKKNLKLTDVTHVFVSHHHIDHTLQLGLFPNAVVVDYASIYENDIWREHNGNYTIAPGIRVIATPGHTHEDASLLVETKEGVYAITHTWWHDDMTPIIDPYAEHVESLKKSRKIILKQADWIFPGHGKLFENPHKHQGNQ